MYFPSAVGLGQTSGAQTIAAKIVQIEGYNPNYAPNNNPGNLVYSASSTIQTSNGAVPGAGGFAAFPTYDDGYNALLGQIQSYADQGLTIQQMMNRYAPSNAANDPTGVNNPNSYANSIASSLGVSPSTSVAAAIGGSGVVDTETDDTFANLYALLPDFSADLSSLSDSGSDTDAGSVSPLLIGGLALLLGVAYAVS